MVRAGPSIDSGGTMTLTREPSGRRASQITRLVDAAADLADDALADVQELGIVAKADVGRLHPAIYLDEADPGTVDHDVGDVVARQQRLERAVAENVVADVLEQLLLLGDRHHDILERDDLVDDVADLVAGAVAVELTELGQVDGVDQGIEDRRLDVVIAFGAAGTGGDGGRVRGLDRGIAPRSGGPLTAAGPGGFAMMSKTGLAPGDGSPLAKGFRNAPRLPNMSLPLQGRQPVDE